MDIGKLLENMVANARTLRRIMLALMALLVLADVLVPSGYDRFVWESIGGFGALYGFVSCVLIIVVSKALGATVLNRPEDYYQDELTETAVRPEVQHKASEHD